MDDLGKPRQHANQSDEGERRCCDLDVVVQVSILGQEAKRLAEGHLADYIEREVLRAVGKLDGPEDLPLRDVLALEEIDEAKELLVYASLEAGVLGVFLARIL